MNLVKQVQQYKCKKQSNYHSKKEKVPQGYEKQELSEEKSFENKKKKKKEKKDKNHKKDLSFKPKQGFQPHINKKQQRNRQEDQLSIQENMIQTQFPEDIMALQNFQRQNWSQVETKKSRNSSFKYREQSFQDSQDST